MKPSYIIPFIFAFLTNHKRQIVRVNKDFQWSSNSWTHNVFRVYEIIFGRRAGIKLEVTGGFDEEGRKWQFAHSREAMINLFEVFIREKLSFKRRAVHVWIPMMQTPMGFPIPASPYLFAIAADNNGAFATGGAGPYTGSCSCTGSNLVLLTASIPNVATTGVTVTKGAVPSASTILGTEFSTQNVSFWYIVGPDTGVSSNVVVTSVGAGGCNGRMASYSGVSQTGFPDSQAQAATASTTSISPTTTVVASSCWLVCIQWNDATGVVTANGGAVLRSVNGADKRGIADTNATVGTGSQSMSLTTDTAGQVFYNVVSMAPVGGGGGGSTPPSIVSDYIIYN